MIWEQREIPDKAIPARTNLDKAGQDRAIRVNPARATLVKVTPGKATQVKVAPIRETLVKENLTRVVAKAAAKVARVVVPAAARVVKAAAKAVKFEKCPSSHWGRA
jgi:hypothetical protein